MSFRTGLAAGVRCRVECVRRVSVMLAVASLFAVGLPASARITTVVSTTSQATWQTNAPVHAVLYSGGVVYIGGEFTEVRPPNSSTGDVARNHIAAFDQSTGDLLPW